MKLLYFDCFNGASGDMILGALLDAGLPLDELRRALGSLGIEEYSLEAERVLRAGVSATRFHLVEKGSAAQAGGAAGIEASPAGTRATRVAVTEANRVAGTDVPAQHSHPQAHEHQHSHPGAPSHPHRSLAEILTLIDQSALSPAGRARARRLFERLAEAEAAIHQMPVERVHLHEVGALDSIIDIVGAVFAVDWFGADRIVVSPLNVGGGMVRSAHGVFPVPAPATVRLLGDAPVYSNGARAELLTPTGALLLTEYAAAFGPVPAMRVARAGYGAGSRDDPETPNVLRVLVGESAEPRVTERIAVLECEIDDMNPQIFGVLMEQLHAAGALEVYYAAVQMKKNRPGTLVTVLAPPDRRDALAGIVFRESTTIGIRYHEVDRERLERELVPVETPLGTIRVKVARRDGAVVNASPEFEDCARLAREHGVAVKDAQAAAMHAWMGKR